MATGGLLAIYAHPDDETFGVGGTMAKYADRGVPVTMVCATRGEVGEIAPGTDATPETLGQFREQELRDAMAILGVHDVRFLDYRDSGMRGTPENEDPRNLHKDFVADNMAAIFGGNTIAPKSGPSESTFPRSILRYRSPSVASVA
jgi:LmbE family N-acetylglucosaminyl deacetylase